MNVLLDTHALFRWLVTDRRISRYAKLVIDDLENQRYVSSVSAFEIANKHRIGKLDAGEILAPSKTFSAMAAFFSYLSP